MNYKQIGFRPFYHQFCVVPITERTRGALAEFPWGEDENGILTYGYYDHQEGLVLEVLAGAKVDGENTQFLKTNDDIRSIIPIDDVAEEEFLFIPDKDGGLAKFYANKLEIVRNYDAAPEIEKTRMMPFLDTSRDRTNIDDVMVHLHQEGLEPEECWVRIFGLEDRFFKGRLLTEPNQDFAVHKGDTLAFGLQKMEGGKIICISEVTPEITYTEKDLEDGHLLEAAVKKFHEESSEINFLEVMQLLKDSWVWIPCTAVLSPLDQKRLEKMVKDQEKELKVLRGKEFKNLDPTRLIPDILQSDGQNYFPIFSNPEAMGEYGNRMSKVAKRMDEVITFAKNNEKEPIGIVLNAFTEPFVLDKQLWDIIDKMKSRIKE